MVRSSWVSQVGLVRLYCVVLLWLVWLGQVGLVGLCLSGCVCQVGLVVLGWLVGLIEFDWSSWVGQGEMVGLGWSGWYGQVGQNGLG